MKKITYLLLLFISISFAQTTAKVSFTAKIENRNSDTLTIYGPKKFKQVIPVDQKGVFQSSFEITEGLHQFSDGKESSMLYLKDGDDLSLTMNAAEFDETIVYKGKGEKENNFLAQKALTDEAFELGLESLLEKEEAVFKAALEKKKTEDLAKLEDFKGKYVYIDVWATWCGPCRAEIPFLKKIEEKYHGKNIVFISISVDTDKDHEKWQKFVTEKELGGIQLFADKNWNSDFIKAFGINAIPRFLLIDPSGKVLKADAARPSSVELTKLLDTLLK